MMPLPTHLPLCVCVVGGVEKELVCGWGLYVPAQPSAITLQLRITCIFQTCILTLASLFAAKFFP